MKLDKIRHNLDWLLMIAIGLIILLPKIGLIEIQGTSTSIRAEDFIVTTVYAVWVGWKLIYDRQLRLTKVHWLMLAVVAIGAISTLVGIMTHSVPYAALGGLNVLRRVEYFGMFWLAYDWLKPSRLRQYMYVLLCYSAVALIIGILQFFDVIPMLSTWEGYNGQLLYYGRNFGFLISTFAAHYELGGYLILMIPIATVLVFSEKRWHLKISLLALLIGYYLLLYFSASRAAYFAMLIEMLVLFVLMKKYWLALLPIVDMTRIVWLYLTGKYSRYAYQIKVIPTQKDNLPTTSQQAATISATPKADISEVHNTLKLANGSEVTLDPGGATRIDVWQNAVSHFLKNPLLGTGYSSIGTGADNQYLRTLAETGIVGLAALLGLVGYVWQGFYRYLSTSEEGLNRYFLLAMCAAIAGIMAQAVLIDILDSSKVALLLWFLVGLGWALVERDREGVK